MLYNLVYSYIYYIAQARNQWNHEEQVVFVAHYFYYNYYMRACVFISDERSAAGFSIRQTHGDNIAATADSGLRDGEHTTHSRVRRDRSTRRQNIHILRACIV